MKFGVDAGNFGNFAADPGVDGCLSVAEEAERLGYDSVWVHDHVVMPSNVPRGPAVAITELVVGVLLIIGLFVGIAAVGGMVMNFSYVFAGSAVVNPLFIFISLFLIMA